jgi:hypothetical protein
MAMASLPRKMRLALTSLHSGPHHGSGAD